MLRASAAVCALLWRAPTDTVAKWPVFQGLGACVKDENFIVVGGNCFRTSFLCRLTVAARGVNRHVC